MISKGKILFAMALLLPGVAIAVTSLRGEPRREQAVAVKYTRERSVLPSELAEWIVTGKRDFVVLDMREVAAYKKGHIQGAVNCQSCHESSAQGKKFLEHSSSIDLSKKIVFYTDNGSEEIQVPKVIHDNPFLYHLEGGYGAWKEAVLNEAKLKAGDPEEVALAKRKHNALRDMLLGKTVSTGSAVQLKIKPIRRIRAHKSADEGC